MRKHLAGLGSAALLAITARGSANAADSLVTVQQVVPSSVGAVATTATLHTGEWRVGKLWLERGFQTTDPRFRHVVEIVLGDKAQTADGKYLSWKSVWRGDQIVALDDVRVAPRPEDIGWHDQKPNPPVYAKMPGYRLVNAACASVCIALWRPENAPQQTLITSIAANGEGEQNKLATLPLKIEAVTVSPAIESGSVSIMVMSDAGPGAAATCLNLRWQWR